MGRGALICALVALAATFLSSQLGGPQLLYALLLGMSLNFLATDERIKPGIDACSRHVLRLGVALLGARITVEQVTQLGGSTALTVALGVLTTVALGLLLARVLRRPVDEGLIAGGSVAICGASAALAVASVLPPTKDNERFTLLVVAGVTLLSTLPMVLYPPIAQAMAQWQGWSVHDSGVFLGATIHDVAQVVAAAALIDGGGHHEATATATIVKLFRVLLLVPLVFVVAALASLRHQHSGGVSTAIGGQRLVPGFLLGFVALVAINSAGWVAEPVSTAAAHASRACLVLAIAAIGIKTQIADLLKLGWVPVAMIVSETVWLALWVLLSHPWWGL